MTDRALLGGAALFVTLLGIIVVVSVKSRSNRSKGKRVGDSDQTKPEVPLATTPSLAPALVALRAEIDAAWPSRSRASDGGLPGAAHHAANPNSDHERGDAYDVTADRVNGPDPDALAELARVDHRVSYVIWNERIANKLIESNAWRPYAKTAIQTDPHTSHVHISIFHEDRDSVASWGVESIKDGSARVAHAEAPLQPVPAGYVNMAQSRVTSARAAWAVELLHDKTFGWGQVRTSDIGGPVAARVETHPPSPTIDHPHRGISLYEPAQDIA